MNIRFPVKIHHHGGIEFRYYPGGVRCLITYQDEGGFITEEGFCQAIGDKIENYDVHKFSELAYEDALRKVNNPKKE